MPRYSVICWLLRGKMNIGDHLQSSRVFSKVCRMQIFVTDVVPFLVISLRVRFKLLRLWVDHFSSIPSVMPSVEIILVVLVELWCG